MARGEKHLTRAARQLSVVTSRIFGCCGLQSPPRDADKLGCHDLAWWLIFLCVMSGWLAFVFLPQRERLALLRDRRQVLATHLKIEQKELRRNQRYVATLLASDPTAWERAARARLGWLEPGELTDTAGWRPAGAVAPRNPVNATPPTPRGALSPPPRPAIPALPPAPPAPPPLEPITMSGVRRPLPPRPARIQTVRPAAQRRSAGRG